MNHNIQDYNNLNIIIGINLCMENLWPVEALRGCARGNLQHSFSFGN